MTIDIGLSSEKIILVTEKNIASRFEEGLLDVFSTPDMIQEIGSTSYQLLKTILPENLTSVGTNVNISHKKASRKGVLIKIKVIIINIDLKKITFSVRATSDDEVIGR